MPVTCPGGEAAPQKQEVSGKPQAGPRAQNPAGVWVTGGRKAQDGDAGQQESASPRLTWVWRVRAVRTASMAKNRVSVSTDVIHAELGGWPGRQPSPWDLVRGYLQAPSGRGTPSAGCPHPALPGAWPLPLALKAHRCPRCVKATGMLHAHSGFVRDSSRPLPPWPAAAWRHFHTHGLQLWFHSLCGRIS